MNKLANKRTVTLIVGIAVTAFCVWFFVKGIEWGALRQSLLGVRWGPIGVAVALGLLSNVIRAVRWGYLMRPIQPVPLSSLLSATFIGFMTIGVLPGRVGEIIRPWVLCEKEKVRFAPTFATIVVERIFDTLAIVAMLIVVLVLLPVIVGETPPSGGATTAFTLADLQKWGRLMGAAGVAAMVVFILLAAYPEKAVGVARKCLFFLPATWAAHALRLVESFLGGMKVLQSKRQAFMVVALSATLWLNIVAVYYAVGFAFAGIKLGFLGACLVVVCTAFAVALPQAPGFLGVFQLAVDWTLNLLHADATDAKSYAILSWGVCFIPVILVGLGYLWKEGLSLRELQAKAQGPAEKAQQPTGAQSSS